MDFAPGAECLNRIDIKAGKPNLAPAGQAKAIMSGVQTAKRGLNLYERLGLCMRA